MSDKVVTTKKGSQTVNKGTPAVPSSVPATPARSGGDTAVTALAATASAATPASQITAPLLSWRVSLGGLTTPDPSAKASDPRSAAIRAATSDAAFAAFCTLHGIIGSESDATIIQL